ncbi:hypothetical protein GCM10022285_39430 [Streptomyces tunisiensis]|uniref:Uncharacterized protein n=1 Tax=Streptomyces tunisiensis TaxID=948699 RepID=A0ABP7YRJ5_9ACTN
MPAPRGRIHTTTLPSHVTTRTAYTGEGIGHPAPAVRDPAAPRERPDRQSVQPFSPVAASTAQAFASVAEATGTIIV